MLTRTWCLMLLALLLWQPVHAQLDIRITQGVEGALPIAIVPFGWQGTAPPPEELGRIVAADLARSGRFAPIPFDDLPGRPVQPADVRFGDWRLLGTSNLVIGRVGRLADGGYRVEFRLYDVYKASQLAGLEFQVPESELRRAAHEISDVVYERLTGEPGAFNTRIAYVTESATPEGAARYSLNIADSDGHNENVVLESTEPLLSPDWSPDGQRIAYVSFEAKRPRVFVQDVRSGSREEVAAFPGLNGAPSWSPDGRRLALTLSKDGNPEIYVLDLSSRRLQRLTHNAAIDTEPGWAPDGSSLVFTSDRGGSPQIYRISATGGRAERVTFEGDYNARARFSPDGTRLALVHGQSGAFRIALLDLENNALQVLTDTRLDESPSFAPNGSMVVYATTDEQGVALATVSIDGRVRHRLAVREGDVREPAWSPFRGS
ncbi:MAG: Tol-Pal system beta propeller repeat protein TolB [Gammaproteobacteria bacterium]|nr:Tol-Pal system beta propeller repeat protein TolB [Gammaproteobacteria bacterium]